MPAQFTLWGVNEILQTIFGKSTAQAENFYLALVKDLSPTAFSAGFELDEPDAEAGYFRAVIPNQSSSWLNDSYDSIGNAQEILFQPALADWGEIHYWALCNAEVEGYVYACGDLAESVYIEALDEFVVSPGALTIALGPIYTQEA